MRVRVLYTPPIHRNVSDNFAHDNWLGLRTHRDAVPGSASPITRVQRGSRTIPDFASQRASPNYPASLVPDE